MKKYILLSVMLLTSGMNIICMKRKHSDDKIIRIDLTDPAPQNGPLIIDLTNSTDEQEETCQICLEDKPSDQFKTLSCCGENTSCNTCLLDLIQASLEEKNIANINCPNRTCVKPINEQDIQSITHAHAQVYQKFCDIATYAWMAKNEKDIKHCPTPDCAYSFINDEKITRTFNCPQCKNLYCSNCLMLHAQTMTCEQAREFSNKEEAANKEWLEKNTKTCPQCKTSVEKNGGCYHMTCTQCKHQFCWKCLNPHDHTNNHPCGLWENNNQINRHNQAPIRINPPIINQPQPNVQFQRELQFQLQLQREQRFQEQQFQAQQQQLRQQQLQQLFQQQQLRQQQQQLQQAQQLLQQQRLLNHPNINVNINIQAFHRIPQNQIDAQEAPAEDLNDPIDQ